MAVTVTPNLTTIHACDAADWSGGSLNQDYHLEGNGCLAEKVSQSLGTLRTYTFSTIDMSGGEHIYFWLYVMGVPDTKVNGGLRVYIEDGSGNYGTWYVGGKDTIDGGWNCFVVDPASTYTSGSGTILTNDIVKVGVQFKVLSKSVGNAANVFWDIVRYGTGLKITGGTSGDKGTFEEIYQDDITNKYGVIKKQGGVYFVQGSLQFGDTSGTNYFSDNGQVIVFKDMPVASDFYKISVTGNSGGTNSFQLGSVVGSGASAIGKSGCVVTSEGTAKYEVLVDSADINELKLYGNTFDTARTVKLGTSTVQLANTIDLIDNIFANTDTFTKNIGGTTNILRNTIADSTSTTAALETYDTAEDYYEFKFISTYGWATGLTSSTIQVDNYQDINATRDLNVDDSSSNVWKFLDSSKNPLTINWTSTGSAYVQLLYSLDLHVEDPDGTDLQNARTMLYEDSQDAIVNLQDTDVNGDSSDDTLVRQDDDASTNFTRGPFILAVYRYGQDPFRAPQTVSAAIAKDITLVDDPVITQSEATALAHAGIVVSLETNPAQIIEYDTGSGTLTEGETLTGGTSGATGVIVEIITGDDTAGRVLLKTRNGTAFDATEGLSSTSWSGNKLNTTVYSFQWYIDAGSNSLDDTYHWLAAKMAMTTPDTWVTNARKRFGKLLTNVGGQYQTERNVADTEGIVIGKRGAGTVEYFTDDSGATIAPSATYTLTVTVKDTAGAIIQNARVYIERDSDGQEIMNELTNASGIAQTTWDENSIAININIRKSTSGTRYFPASTFGTIDGGFTLTQVLIEDTIAN